MTNINLISISGKKGHGKDLLSDIILALHYEPYVKDKFGEVNENNYHLFLENYGKVEMDYCFEVKKFASKLKQITAMLLGVDVNLLEDREYKYKELPEEWWMYKVEQVLLKDHYTKEKLGKPEFFDTKVFYTEEEAQKYYDDHMASYKEMGTTHYTAAISIFKPTPRWFMQNIGTEALRNNIHQNVWVNALFSEFKPQCYKELDDYKCGLYYTCPDYEDGECHSKEYPHWIITDTRFPNEMKAIEKNNGIKLKIIRYQSADQWAKEYSNWFNIVEPRNKDAEDFEWGWYKWKITDNQFIEWLEDCKVEYKKPRGQFLESINHPSETSLDDYDNWDYVIKNDGSIQDLIDKVRKICKELKLIK